MASGNYNLTEEMESVCEMANKYLNPLGFEISLIERYTESKLIVTTAYNI